MAPPDQLRKHRGPWNAPKPQQGNTQTTPEGGAPSTTTGQDSSKGNVSKQQ